MMLRSWHTCLAVTLAVAAAIPASAANRMFPKFDVRDFGAKGDGVVKDTAAIQRAIDAVACGWRRRGRPAGRDEEIENFDVLLY